MAWPELPLKEWEGTYRTLHMWTQMVGKIRLALAPFQNHWWQVALYVTPTGLTTSAIPLQAGAFELRFNLVDHRLELQSSDGLNRAIDLAPKTIAAFYRELFEMLREAGIKVEINPKPQEIPNPIPFDQDDTQGQYDPEYADRLRRVLLSIDSVFKEFRGRFFGKSSPVHFFWGSFDLCCTRFNGRRAAPRPGVITSEAYSHECCSLGWWPGGGAVNEPSFYAYMAPEPPGYNAQGTLGEGEYYHQEMREFLLPYHKVRVAKDPRAQILEFAEVTYLRGAELAGWDRAFLNK